MVPSWEKSEAERFAHHLGNLFVSAILAMALLWGAAIVASHEWSVPIPMEVMRWVTVVFLITGAGFFVLFGYAAIRNMDRTAEEERLLSTGTPPSSPR